MIESNPTHRFSGRRIIPALCAFLASTLFLASTASAEGTLAGTDIANTADVSYVLDGTPVTQSSNTVTITVAEILDVAVVLQSPQVTVASGDTDQALVYTVTNTGNGSESFRLDIDNSDATDDFDPMAATPAIYFDTDGSGDFSVGDVAYSAGTNDPVLAPDESITIILVNNIPLNLNNGDVGRSELTAEANTGSGAAGTRFPGAGTNGTDAVTGTTTGLVSVSGEYVVADVTLLFNKSAVVSDQFGGSDPVPGATITYTITVEVTGTGTATAVQLEDLIPANTTYTGNSLTFNGTAMTDATGDDAGELDSTGPTPKVVVVVGDMTAASGLQTVTFQVTID